MAQTRVEKVGTIFTRVTSLIRGGAMSESDKPLWYKIYEAFPPKYEPSYERSVPKVELKQIFYKEDVIRARFHKDCKNLGMTNLKNTKYLSQTRKFLDAYNDLIKLKLSKEEAYKQALEKCNYTSTNVEDQNKIENKSEE
ncbi:PREDICTED: probable 28S ribosomal protein S23, mitochondrial [Polistes dominula]|uniref:Small ribosomal subunit protein mS23 n=1 Tax=Polistes dominula TaxID=743375 RepID=A0ABM1IJ16_POLDO|nr:PREDICTED: probable 28S ribosomal protein S23, mitochondrial [Polistes dominula]